MGEVYLAEDTRLHRKVAIKFLSDEAATDEQAQQAKKRLLLSPTCSDAWGFRRRATC
jgi:hypothetical protein